jgi:NitT/TauT family transport system substrate-binding protein
MTEKVRIGIATPAGMTAANGYFSAASALAFDCEEGLDFDFFYGEEPGTTARALCSGECDIASLNITVGLLGRDEGLSIKAVYGKARRTHRWFAVMPESPIHSLPDLRDKRIACDFPHLQALAESALEEENVPRGSYQWVPWRGSGMETGAMLDPLRGGDVDAVFLIDWNAGDFNANGLFLRRLPSKALDHIRLSSCLWVTDSYLADKPRAILGTGRAMARVTVFALENPEETVRLMWKRHPETCPSPRDHDRILRRDLEIMKARLDSFGIDPVDRDPRWGIIEEREIIAWQNFLLAGGAIKQRLDPRVFYTNQFVDDYNRFDATQIRKKAYDTNGTNKRSAH